MVMYVYSVSYIIVTAILSVIVSFQVIKIRNGSLTHLP